MEREAVSNFEGKLVKLTFHNDFNLVGTILEIYEETILFETEQKKSAISIADIRSLVEK
jgi:ribosome maturation factor RimP